MGLFDNDAPSLYRKGNDYFFDEKYHKAIKYYEKALEQAPKYKEAWNNLGLSYKILGDESKAVECYEKALEIDPDFVNALYNLGILYHAQENHERALDCYERVIELEPEFVKAWNNIGNIHRDALDRDNAIKYYESAVEIDPKFAKAIVNLGIVYEAWEMYQKAIDCYEKALSLPDEHKDAWDINTAKENLSNTRIKLRKIKRDELSNEFPRIERKYKEERYEEAINELDKVMEVAKTYELDEILDRAKELHNNILSIEKLKKIISVSRRIKLEMMRKSLGMTEEAFLDKIYDWAAHYDFIIDGDYLIINQETVSNFITELDAQFREWETKEQAGMGKI